MGAILEAVIDYCKAQDFKYFTQEGVPLLGLSFTCRNASFDCYAVAKEEERILVFASRSPARVPQERRGDMCELVCRINCRIAVGSFDFEVDAGWVQFRTSVEFGRDRPSEAAVHTLIESNLFLVDQYFPALASVAAGQLGPVAALAFARPSPSAVN